MTKMNYSATALGNAYQHMEMVANSVVYRTHKFEKNSDNELLWKRVIAAENAYDDAKQDLMDAFMDVFVENGINFDDAYDMAREAAQGAAHSLRTQAWSELKALAR